VAASAPITMPAAGQRSCFRSGDFEWAFTMKLGQQFDQIRVVLIHEASWPASDSYLGNSLFTGD
jgi:hypothetical protein